MQNSASKIGDLRESSQNNYLRKNIEHHASASVTQNNSKKTPRLEARSYSKTSANGLRGFEEYKDTASMGKFSSLQRGFKLDQAQERSIIEEVKTQKQKLENEMRNLINLYAQICDEESASGVQANPLLFQSRHALGASDSRPFAARLD